MSNKKPYSLMLFRQSLNLTQNNDNGSNSLSLYSSAIVNRPRNNTSILKSTCVSEDLV